MRIVGYCDPSKTKLYSIAQPKRFKNFRQELNCFAAGAPMQPNNYMQLTLKANAISREVLSIAVVVCATLNVLLQLRIYNAAKLFVVYYNKVDKIQKIQALAAFIYVLQHNYIGTIITSKIIYIFKFLISNKL